MISVWWHSSNCVYLYPQQDIVSSGCKLAIDLSTIKFGSIKVCASRSTRIVIDVHICVWLIFSHAQISVLKWDARLKAMTPGMALRIDGRLSIGVPCWVRLVLCVCPLVVAIL